MKASAAARFAAGTAIAIAMSLSGGTALAQSAGGSVPAGDPQAAESNRTPETPPASSGIGDIVVTAQRRTESLQKSSLAISVVSGKDIQAVTSPTALTTLVPSVQIGTNSNNLQVYIRGIGDTSPNARAQSAVATNIDGVYVQTGSAIAPMMFDISRVEILKGPQGTLYGRNTSGGALNIITNKPELGRISGYVGGDVGNYNLYSAIGALNIPIGNTIAIRGAFSAIHRDGYNTDGGNDQKEAAGRIKALWQPSERFSLLLTVEGAHAGGLGFGSVVLPKVGGESPWTGIRDPRYDPYTSYISLDGSDTPISGAQVDDMHLNNKILNFSAELNWDLGPATLTIIPTHQYQKLDFSTYGDFHNQNLETNKHDILEARLGHTSERLKWVIGGYYYQQDNQFQAIVANDNPATPAVGDYIITSTRASQRIVSKAAFGEATLTVLKGFRLIGGLRYTDERLHGLSQSDRTEPFDFPGPDSVIPNTVSRSTNFKVGTEWDVAPESMLYATYSTGFKGGGVYLVTGVTDNPARVYDPERVHAFTVGSRNRFLNDMLQINLEGFYWKYYDQQASFVGVDYDGTVGALTKNVGNATIYGFNADVVLKPTPRDTLHGNVEFDHTRYDSFGYIASSPYTAGSLCRSIPGPDTKAPVGPDTYTIDCTGLPLARAPKWSGGVDYNHRFDLANGGSVLASAAMQFASSRYLTVDFVPSIDAPAYATFDADLTYNAPNNRWSLTAFMRNISNEAVYVGASRFNLATVPRYFYAAIAAPRTFGARFRYNF